MPGLGRTGDVGVGICCCHSDPDCRHKTGIIITSSNDGQCNSLGLGRVSDIVMAECGHVGMLVTGSTMTTTNSMSQAYLGSGFSGCFTGVIVSGSNDAITG